MKFTTFMLHGLLSLVLTGSAGLFAQDLKCHTSALSSLARGAAIEDGLTTSPAAMPRATQGAGRGSWSATVSAPVLASPKFADLTGDGVAEVLLTTYGISNPYGEGWLHAWNGAGQELTGFPVNLSGAAPGTAAIGDIDDDGDVEIVQGTWDYLYVFNADGSNYPGWPKTSYVTQAAALADLDGDGDLEIICPSSNEIEVYHHNGSVFAGFPVTGGNDLTAPAVGDLDGDGDLEIVAGGFVASGSTSDFVYVWHHTGAPAAGFPVTTHGSVKASPALADLDNDGTMELIANCWNKAGTDYLYVWDHAGGYEPGWPIQAAYIRLSSPTVGDLDDDGDLEIVVGGWATNPYSENVHAYHHDATPVAGFPVSLNNSPSGNVNSSCTIGDIDGDERPEIVVKAVNNIYALNHNGSLVTGFPLFLDDESHSGTTSPSPALGDADGDDLVEIFAASCFNNVMMVDQPGVFSRDLLPWPTYRDDPSNNGTFAAPSLVASLHTLSASVGGVVDFELDAGSAYASRGYILVGGASGTHPGTPLPGGLATLPLNRDFVTNFILAHINGLQFIDFQRNLDPTGFSKARLDTTGPIPAILVGSTLHFAFATRLPYDFASSPVAVVVSP